MSASRAAGSPDRRGGLLFIALSALVFGSLGVTTKGLLTVATTNALSITLLRAAIALPALLISSAVVLGTSAIRIAPGDLRLMALAGVLMAGYQVAFVVSLMLVNVTITTLVTLCTVPVCVAVLSRVLLGEELRPPIVVALGCAVVGVALLVGFQPPAETGARASLGIALALVAAVAFSLFQLCGRVLANRYHPMQTLSVFFGVTVLVLLPLTLMNGLVTDYPPIGWLLLLHLGLGVSVLGYALLVLGLRTTPVTTATIVSMLEPLTGTMLAWLVFHERLGALGLLGAALLLSAMGIVFRATPVASPHGAAA